MTLAKPTPTDATSFGISTSDTVEPHSIDLENRLTNLTTQATDNVLKLWSHYRPMTTGKTQAVWHLLRSTDPVQLLLAAAVAVLAIALVTLVAVFNGLLILLLKLAALGLAAIAVGQWVVRGVNWADDRLPTTIEPKE